MNQIKNIVEALLLSSGEPLSADRIHKIINSKEVCTKADILEAINTAGSKSSLTSALDALSDTNLRKALGQIEGVTIKSIKGSGFKRHSTFKR